MPREYVAQEPFPASSRYLLDISRTADTFLVKPAEAVVFALGENGAPIEVQEDVNPDSSGARNGGSAALLFGEWHAEEFHTSGGMLGHTATSYAAGTAYSLTASAALLNFGTTDPQIILDQKGTYLITGRCQLKYNAATFAANRTATVKMRRTNNTAADLTNGTVTATTRIITTITDLFQDVTWSVIYTTTNTDDAIELQGLIDVVPTAGSLDAVAASLVALRIA